MTRYRVHGLHRETGISLSIAVDARDPEHARELAAEQSVISDNVIDIGPAPLTDYRAPTSRTDKFPSRPIQWAPSNRDRQTPIFENLGTTVAMVVCGVVAIMLYLFAAVAWIVLINTINTPKGVQSIPAAELLTAVFSTAAAAILHALATIVRLLSRIAPTPPTVENSLACKNAGNCHRFHRRTPSSSSPPPPNPHHHPRATFRVARSQLTQNQALTNNPQIHPSYPLD